MQVPEAVRARLEALRRDPHLVGLAGIAGGPIHLVGGSVRDLMLGREGRSDMDVAVPQGALALARAYADRVGGSFVPLDERRGIARVALRTEDGHRELDIADYQRPGLIEDLRGRDFTMNAMAVPLGEEAELVDPTGGLDDLLAGRVRVPSVDVLDDDPLRVLRAYRFAAVLGFEVDAATRAAAASRAETLRRVAAERVRDELFKVLAVTAAWPHVARMEEDGVLAVLLPEVDALRGLPQAGFHHLDAYRHSLLACEMLESQALPFAGRVVEPLSAYLSKPLAYGRTRVALLKLAALLHDVGKKTSQQVDPETGKVSYRGHDATGADMVDDVARRLRLSRAETAVLRSVVRWHLRPLDMQPLADLKPRVVRHFFRDAGAAAVDTLVVALADSAASRGPKNTPEVQQALHERVAWMLEWHFLPRAEGPLLDGHEVARLARLAPGPEVGVLLDRLADAQADGEISTRAEAVEYVRRMVRQPQEPA